MSNSILETLVSDCKNPCADLPDEQSAERDNNLHQVVEREHEARRDKDGSNMTADLCNQTLDLIETTLLLLQEEEPLCRFSRIEKNEPVPLKIKIPSSPIAKTPPPIATPPLPTPVTTPPIKNPLSSSIPKMTSPVVTPPSEPPLDIPKPPPLKKPSPSLFRPILAKIAPHLAILDEIPNDLVAKQIATRWKTKNLAQPISIISHGELPSHKLFLSEIGVAMSVYFHPARVIEAETIETERQWDAFLQTKDLKLIIVCDATLWQLHNLRKFYKEVPAKEERHLGSVPVFLLPDLSLYLKDPKLKKSLWKMLCQQLSKS